MDEHSRGGKWVTVILMVIATLGAIFWSITHLRAYSQEAPRELLEAGALGYAMGRIVVETIVAWAIACAAIGLVQGRLWAWRAGIFLPIMMVAVIAADMAVVFGPSLTPGGRDTAAIVKLNQDIQNQVLADREAYFKELYGLGYPDFLHPASLGAPNGLEHAQEKIKKARAIVHKFRERNDASVAEFRVRIEKLNIREESKKEALAGFEAGTKNVDSDRAKLWELQDATMAEYQAMLDDLVKSRGHWHTDADKIAFSRQRDLDDFNKHLEAGAKLEKETAALVEKVKAARHRAEGVKG